MLLFIGDIHGDLTILRELKKRVDNSYPLEIIQVGDFGYWPGIDQQWFGNYPWKVYFIDGNHEYFPMLNYATVTELHKNLFYVPRGSVLNIDGYEIGFMGGGFSVDFRYRKEGFDWFRAEEVLESDINKLRDKKLDILVTHTPPTNIILRNFGPLVKQHWGLRPNDMDTSAPRIERLWGELGFPPMICGHMHRSVVDSGCRILNINEIYAIPSREGPVDFTQPSATLQ